MRVFEIKGAFKTEANQRIWDNVLLSPAALPYLPKWLGRCTKNLPVGLSMWIPPTIVRSRSLQQCRRHWASLGSLSASWPDSPPQKARLTGWMSKSKDISPVHHLCWVQPCFRNWPLTCLGMNGNWIGELVDLAWGKQIIPEDSPNMDWIISCSLLVPWCPPCIPCLLQCRCLKELGTENAPNSSILELWEGSISVSSSCCWWMGWASWTWCTLLSAPSSTLWSWCGVSKMAHCMADSLDALCPHDRWSGKYIWRFIIHFFLPLFLSLSLSPFCPVLSSSSLSEILDLVSVQKYLRSLARQKKCSWSCLIQTFQKDLKTNTPSISQFSNLLVCLSIRPSILQSYFIAIHIPVYPSVSLCPTHLLSSPPETSHPLIRLLSHASAHPSAHTPSTYVHIHHPTYPPIHSSTDLVHFNVNDLSGADFFFLSSLSHSPTFQSP